MPTFVEIVLVLLTLTPASRGRVEFVPQCPEEATPTCFLLLALALVVPVRAPVLALALVLGLVLVVISTEGVERTFELIHLFLLAWRVSE
jgi:hypothetical protein